MKQMDKYIKNEIDKITTTTNYIVTNNKYNIYQYQSKEEHIPNIQDRIKIFDNKGE